MPRRKTDRERLLEDAKQPSQQGIDVLLRGGAGVHRDSLAARNKRNGRLKGAEKAKFRRGDYD